MFRQYLDAIQSNIQRDFWPSFFHYWVCLKKISRSSWILGLDLGEIDSPGYYTLGRLLAGVSYHRELDSQGYHTLGRLTCRGFISRGDWKIQIQRGKFLTNIENMAQVGSNYKEKKNRDRLWTAPLTFEKISGYKRRKENPWNWSVASSLGRREVTINISLPRVAPAIPVCKKCRSLFLQQ